MTQSRSCLRWKRNWDKEYLVLCDALSIGWKFVLFWICNYKYYLSSFSIRKSIIRGTVSVLKKKKVFFESIKIFKRSLWYEVAISVYYFFRINVFINYKNSLDRLPPRSWIVRSSLADGAGIPDDTVAAELKVSANVLILVTSVSLFLKFSFSPSIRRSKFFYHLKQHRCMIVSPCRFVTLHR